MSESSDSDLEPPNQRCTELVLLKGRKQIKQLFKSFIDIVEGNYMLSFLLCFFAIRTNSYYIFRNLSSYSN